MMTTPENSLASVDDEIDLAELWAILWHQKLLIFIITLVVFLTGLAITARMPEVYRTTATVLLKGGQGNHSITAIISGSSESSVDFDTSIKLLTSYQFMDKISRIVQASATRYNVIPWDASQLHQNLSIKQVAKTNLLEISFEGQHPTFTALVANTITEHFITYQAELMQPNSKNNGEWINSRIRTVKALLAADEQRLNMFRQRNSAIDITNMVKVNQDEITLLFIEQRSLKKEHESLTRLLIKLSHLKDDTAKKVAIQVVANTKQIKELLLLTSRQQAQFSQIKLRYLQKHPKYQVMALKIAETKLQIASELRYLTYRYQARLTEVNHLLININSKQKKEKANLEQSIVKFQEFEQIDRHLRANIKLLETLTISEKKFQLLDDSNTGAFFIIVDPAIVPNSPIKPKKALIAVLSLLLGLMFAVFLVIIGHFMSNKQSRYRQIIHASGFRILGELPSIERPRGQRNQPIVDGYGENFDNYQESVRTIRTNLLLDPKLRNQRLIAVTSLTPSEGKSSSCIQLAKSFSELERVIIIDADLRSPSIAAALGEYEHRLGLTNIIANTHRVEQCIFSSPMINADVLPSGIRPINPLLFLSSNRFPALLTLLLKKYDRVILECPPILSASDALLVSKYVNGLTLVTDIKQNSAAKFNQHIEQLSHLNIEISGVILNRVKPNKQYQYYSSRAPKTKFKFR